jgi:type II secretory pathway component GspD/PulD (secretin)
VEIHNLPYSRVFEHLRRDFGVNILMDGPLDGRLEMSLADATRAELVDAILGSGPLRYSRDGTTYRVASREGFRERRVTRLFQLQFIDAADVKRFAESLLSPVGKIEVFNRRARSGFAFGPPTSTRRTTSAPTAQAERSDTVSVTDTSVVVDNIAALIARLDVRPRQVSIEVKMVEVTLQRNETLGINWNVKATMNGASQPTVLPFDSQSAGSSTVNNAFRFGTISAEDFQMVLQMLEKRNRLKVLSSPRISTLNNQEASILIGDKFPITVETVDPQTAVRTVTLDRYEQIGVQLQVVPQISGDSAVNLIIHPAVSSVGQLIQERFPVISTREADTQILVRNGDTAVIGGLLQERTDSIRTSVPGLGKVPFLGRLFQSDTNHTTTVDLLIFVTPHIVPDDSAVRDRPSQARRTVIAEEGKSAQRSRAGWSEPEPTSSRPMARKETASPVARVSRRARVAPDLGSYGFRGRARPGQRDAYKNTPVQEDESAPRDRARLAPAPSDRFERHLQELQSVLDSRDDSSWEDGSRVRAGGVER